MISCEQPDSDGPEPGSPGARRAASMAQAKQRWVAAAAAAAATAAATADVAVAAALAELALPIGAGRPGGAPSSPASDSCSAASSVCPLSSTSTCSLFACPSSAGGSAAAARSSPDPSPEPYLTTAATTQTIALPPQMLRLAHRRHQHQGPAQPPSPGAYPGGTAPVSPSTVQTRSSQTLLNINQTLYQYQLFQQRQQQQSSQRPRRPRHGSNHAARNWGYRPSGVPMADSSTNTPRARTATSATSTSAHAVNPRRRSATTMTTPAEMAQMRTATTNTFAAHQRVAGAFCSPTGPAAGVRLVPSVAAAAAGGRPRYLGGNFAMPYFRPPGPNLTAAAPPRMLPLGAPVLPVGAPPPIVPLAATLPSPRTCYFPRYMINAPERLSPAAEAQLQLELEAYLATVVESDASRLRRRACCEKVERLMQAAYPRAHVKAFLFGSSVNGLGTPSSDVDILLSCAPGAEGSAELANMHLLGNVLRQGGMNNVVSISEARVPICKFDDPELGLKCDINVNNVVALRNTEFIRQYVALDVRVQQLLLVVKHWAKQRVLNDAKGGTLSSYCWTMVVLSFLQTRQPPVVPSLHAAYAAAVSAASTPEAAAAVPTRVIVSGVDCSFYDDAASLPFVARNTESLASLLYGFFVYMATRFDYDTQVLSVRAGAPLSKSSKDWDAAVYKGQLNFFCVEEPFVTTRNLANNADAISVEGLRREFARALLVCIQSMDMLEWCRVSMAGSPSGARVRIFAGMCDGWQQPVVPGVYSRPVVCPGPAVNGLQSFAPSVESLRALPQAHDVVELASSIQRLSVCSSDSSSLGAASAAGASAGGASAGGASRGAAGSVTADVKPADAVSEVTPSPTDNRRADQKADSQTVDLKKAEHQVEDPPETPAETPQDPPAKEPQTPRADSDRRPSLISGVDETTSGRAPLDKRTADSRAESMKRWKSFRDLDRQQTAAATAPSPPRLDTAALPPAQTPPAPPETDLPQEPQTSRRRSSRRPKFAGEHGDAGREAEPQPAPRRKPHPGREYASFVSDCVGGAAGNYRAAYRKLSDEEVELRRTFIRETVLGGLEPVILDVASAVAPAAERSSRAARRASLSGTAPTPPRAASFVSVGDVGDAALCDSGDSSSGSVPGKTWADVIRSR